MNDILIAILVILVLLIIILLPNIKYIREQEAVVIERLGKFHKIITKKGFIITIPFFERILETINLENKHLVINNAFFKIEIIYKIIDVKTYVYSNLDSKAAFIKEITNLEAVDEKILINNAKNYGILIINNNLVYNENKEE